MTSINELLMEFSKLSRSNREKGTKFEKLIANYLMTDPQYADRLSDVWLWSEWSDSKGVDVGIDLVAREKNTGEYWAIQCKFFHPEHVVQKSDIDSFFTASGKRFKTKEGQFSFSQRIIFSTSDLWTKHAENALEDQTIPTSRIWFRDLENSPIDWSRFSLANVNNIKLKPKKILKEHQEEAISKVLEGFKNHDRGKLIMACGTGKTFTSLRLMEKIVPIGGKVLFLSPSISLVSQSLREWTAEALEPIHSLVICSDTKVGKEEGDLRTYDLAYPATTNAKKLSSAISKLSKDRRTIIFSTYQSIKVIADAQKKNLDEFDLIICDEAHRTTGLTLPGEKSSYFRMVHNNKAIRGNKRIYMTATPRIYSDASKSRAEEFNATLFSMDDEKEYGPQFYRLGFGHAVERDLLSDYKVLIVAVKEIEMAKLANNYNNAYKIDEKKAIDVDFATKIIGSWKGLSKNGLVVINEEGKEEQLTDDATPMLRAVAFSKSIKDSKQVTEIFTQLVKKYQQLSNEGAEGLIDCAFDHVDGTMNAMIRKTALDWLKSETILKECRILSNARCLSEGVDVPSLDAVIFFDTRESIIDIVQSVGRVMRKSPGKKYGYIILPVCIPSERVKDYNSYIENDPRFKGIWKVIKALRAHDESLVDEAEFRRKIKIVASPRVGAEREKNDQLLLNFPELPLDLINGAVYAAIPKKLGDREYWSDWAKGICNVAERLISRIEELLSSDSKLTKDFSVFLKGLQNTLNPSVTRKDAIEMLAQHMLTLPVFQALFSGSDFPDKNAVGKVLDSIVRKFDDSAVASETEGLEKFYNNIRDRIKLAKSDKSKQDIIRSLYDTFFQNAFPQMAKKLGIVYTPVPVVDFILNSVQFALRKHFKTNIGDKKVQILDPFSGAGTFLVRLIQSNLIADDDISYKYSKEFHANEILLLAYYIATINIETAYHSRMGDYKNFDGMVLVDTFQMTEEKDSIDRIVLAENSNRAESQLSQSIRVIFSNPPYSAQQDSENYDNKNLIYPTLDSRIRETYAEKSSSQLLKNLYDSYVRAIRWASDRVADKGIIAFVTNGSFLNANNMDGLRKSLTDEFTDLYVLNLRGNARTQGEQRKKEGGGIFGEGSRAPVAITVMVKDSSYAGKCTIHYYDIGDYLKQQQKLDALDDFISIENINWSRITPNPQGDWVDQRDPAFNSFLQLGNKASQNNQVIFDTYSQCILSGRDAWVYNSNPKIIESNIKRTIKVFNTVCSKYSKLSLSMAKNDLPSIEKIIETDPKKISWTHNLKRDIKRCKKITYQSKSLIKSMYRPFFKQWLYYNKGFNERVYQIPKLFPTPRHDNLVIMITGIGAAKAFSCLVSDVIPNYHMHDTGQCFPLYWYEEADSKTSLQGDMFATDSVEYVDGYIRHTAISNWSLSEFRKHYNDNSISKEDIFWYVYGILHSPDYKQRFTSNLKKMLPRIPFASNFKAFSKAGRTLGNLHLNYETIDPYPVKEESGNVEQSKHYRVNKIGFGIKTGQKDKSVIIFNNFIVLRDIPLEAYDYIVNGKSAIECVLDRYQVTVDKISGIKNDPNDWSDNPRYILDLIKRIVRVSLDSVKIVNSLPSLQEKLDR